MTSEIIYEGNLRTKATHLKSGMQIISDAPVDNNGKGEAFSPTDTVATALASCLLTIMGITAERKAWNIVGAKASVNKIMSAQPRRISTIEITIEMPGSLDQKARSMLERVARNCPVAKSLHPDLSQKLIFQYNL